MGRKTTLTTDNFMHRISQYGMQVFPDAKMHFVQILRFMCLDRNPGYELCSTFVTPAEGEGLNPLASQSFMSYKRNLLSGKVSIRDVYSIIARHLPPDDPTYLESMSAAELEEMNSRDVGWKPRPRAFDSMSLEDALNTTRKVGVAEPMTSNGNSGMNAPAVAM